tara:strand:+ start:1065 stop:1457 length:393 start_codon:yes stop_codon:yes gene_type:complete
LNKSTQLSLALLSASLIFILGLSTVNKTIHNGLFHSDFLTENNPASSGCTGHHEGECDKGESTKHTKECDSTSCPVNVFNSGLLALKSVPALTFEQAIEYNFIEYLLISHHDEVKKRSHLVRGPPEKKQV